MRYYITDGITAIVATYWDKPPENYPSFEAWRRHIDGAEKIHLSQKMQENLKNRGLGDWNEVSNYKNFRLLAVHPSEADWD